MNFNEEKFNELLAKKKILRKDLCKTINMNPSTMHRTINFNNGDFRVVDIANMAKVLGISIVEFLEVYENE
ncbi:MAG: helix-turn-helix transcriptional regulator [Roseburia sp.]|nr:helix-turn-helix transcriptional regulator [Anaeroplasma bactoclasticum]MCM1195518.1 helix-turn-helix transcriptional regulator [Roseburia sp.]